MSVPPPTQPPPPATPTTTPTVETHLSPGATLRHFVPESRSAATVTHHRAATASTTAGAGVSINLQTSTVPHSDWQQSPTATSTLTFATISSLSTSPHQQQQQQQQQQQLQPQQQHSTDAQRLSWQMSSTVNMSTARPRDRSMSPLFASSLGRSSRYHQRSPSSSQSQQQSQQQSQSQQQQQQQYRRAGMPFPPEMPNINIVESNTSGGGGGSGSSGGELPTEPSPALSSVRASTHDDGDDSFPYHGLKSTTDAGVDVFRSQNPQTFDGRGVVIAIIDSGVDPSVEGLRTTTTGLPKVVDIVDCTGTGDVNTSTVRVARLCKLASNEEEQEDNGDDGSKEEEMLVLDGLSGRTLILGRDWVNPTGVYHVGVTWLKAFAPHRFFQDKLLPAYMNTQSQRTTAIKHDIELRLQRLSATASTGSDAAIEIEELRARLKVLDHFESQYRESGPVCDCAVFHDGKVWRAAIDLDETGDLRNVPLMTDYSREYQWRPLSSPTVTHGLGMDLSDSDASRARDELDQLSHIFGSSSVADIDDSSAGGLAMPVFSVNIYDNGRLLSIVTQSSDHGTHVAGIAAAYHPDSPELNGIAPGAQLVSINISDCRIPGEETSLSVIRALRAVERCAASGLGCHIVNMSFSESVRNTPGRCEFIAQLADELMRNGHHIFVASAGNNGPGMSSVSAPGGVTSSCIGVGAYLGQAEIDACYGMVGGGSTLSSGPYTFSSRGPFADGCQGVNLYAPGGALSCQPRFFDGKLGHLSGTSMAAPYASGAIALLLSGMMQTGMHWSYPRIRRALIQTSRPLNSNDDVDGSCGLLQVQPAWEYLCEFRDNPILDISFDTKVTCDRKSSRGIYLRELYEFESQLKFAAAVKPIPWRRSSSTSPALSTPMVSPRIVTLPRYRLSGESRAHSATHLADQAIPALPAMSHVASALPVVTVPTTVATAATIAAANPRSAITETLASSCPTVVSSSLTPTSFPQRTLEQSVSVSSSPLTRFLAQNGAQAAMSGNGGGGGSSSASSDSGMSRSPGPASGVRFIRLVSTQPWAVVPRHVYMTAAGCNFNISVNSPVLAAGSAHFASVLGYDSSESEHLGPLFSIPVTACRPLEMGDSSRLDLDPIYFEPGSIFRSFVAVPEHALYATVTTTAYNDAPAQDSARFVFSYLQLVAHDTAADHHTYLEKEMFHGSHGDGRSDSQVFRDRVPLCGGHTLEITVAPKWSGRQSCRLGLQIEFGGVAVVGGQSPSRRGAVSMNTAAGYTRLDLYAGVKREEAVWPVASLSHWRRTLLPRSHSIMVVDDIRDSQAVGRSKIDAKMRPSSPAHSAHSAHPAHLAPSSHLLYELCLVYSLQHSSDYSATYRLTAPALEGMMYDAWHSGSLLHVYDCNGQLLHTQSARSSLFSLDKRGEYSVKLLVRHRDVITLHNIAQHSPHDSSSPFALICDRRLPQKIPVHVASSISGVFNELGQTTIGSPAAVAAVSAASSRSSYTPLTLSRGERAVVYLASPPKRLLPTDVQTGDILHGALFADATDIDATSQYTLQMPVLLNSSSPAHSSTPRIAASPQSVRQSTPVQSTPSRSPVVSTLTSYRVLQQQTTDSPRPSTAVDASSQSTIADIIRQSMENAERSAHLDLLQRLLCEQQQAPASNPLIPSLVETMSTRWSTDAIVQHALLEASDPGCHQRLSMPLELTSEQCRSIIEHSEAILSPIAINISPVLIHSAHLALARAKTAILYHHHQHHYQLQLQQQQSIDLLWNVLFEQIAGVESNASARLCCDIESHIQHYAHQFVKSPVAQHQLKQQYTIVDMPLAVFSDPSAVLAIAAFEQARDPAGNRLGVALVTISRAMHAMPLVPSSSEYSRLLAKLRLELTRKIGWPVWAKHFERRLVVEFPPLYQS